jgi:hypothetical protein
MRDNLDPLEQELAGLKPREPSPELARRVDERLEQRSWRVFRAVFAGVLTGVFFLLWFFADVPPWKTTRIAPPPAPPTVTPVSDESRPTLQAYRRAISHSEDDFEALLDKHAAAGAESGSIQPFDRTEFTSFGER